MNPQKTLNESVKRGDIEGVRNSLALGADPKEDRSWALCMATARDDIECVELLLPVSDPTDAESDALQRAAWEGHRDCVRILIPVSKPKADESHALRRAAVAGHVECVRMLLPESYLEKALTRLVKEGKGDAASLIESVIQEDVLRETHMGKSVGHARNGL